MTPPFNSRAIYFALNAILTWKGGRLHNPILSRHSVVGIRPQNRLNRDSCLAMKQVAYSNLSNTFSTGLMHISLKHFLFTEVFGTSLKCWIIWQPSLIVCSLWGWMSSWALIFFMQHCSVWPSSFPDSWRFSISCLISWKVRHPGRTMSALTLRSMSKTLLKEWSPLFRGPITAWASSLNSNCSSPTDLWVQRGNG